MDEFMPGVTYDSNNHRASKGGGYNNPAVLKKYGRLGARVIRRLMGSTPETWTIVAPATSGVMFAAAMRMYIPEGYPLKVVAVQRMETHYVCAQARSVWVDDYFCSGNQFKNARKELKKQDMPDIAIVMDAGRCFLDRMQSNEFGDLHTVFVLQSNDLWNYDKVLCRWISRRLFTPKGVPCARSFALALGTDTTQFPSTSGTRQLESAAV